MKTTIELPDDLAREAKRLAAESGSTLRSLVEEGLRREVARLTERPVWNPDPDLAYGEGGLTPRASAMSWAEIREDSMTR